MVGKFNVSKLLNILFGDLFIEQISLPLVGVKMHLCFISADQTFVFKNLNFSLY